MKQGKREKKPRSVEFSKKALTDTRALLWIISLGGLALAFYAIYEGYNGAMPWITALVGLPWASRSTEYAFYTSLAKSDHREGGITYERAKAAGFKQGSENSPSI